LEHLRPQLQRFDSIVELLRGGDRALDLKLEHLPELCWVIAIAQVTEGEIVVGEGFDSLQIIVEEGFGLHYTTITCSV